MKNTIHILFVFMAGAVTASCVLLFAFPAMRSAFRSFGLQQIDSMRHEITIKDTKPEADTTVSVGKFQIPVIAKDIIGVGKERIPIQKYFFFTDTLHHSDTIYIRMGRQQKYYKTDDYEAWVSGINPRLDSLRFKTYKDVITNTYTPQIKQHSLALYAAPSFDGINTTLPIGLEYSYSMKRLELSAGVGYEMINRRLEVQGTIKIPFARW